MFVGLEQLTWGDADCVGQGGDDGRGWVDPAGLVAADTLDRSADGDGQVFGP